MKKVQALFCSASVFALILSNPNSSRAQNTPTKPSSQANAAAASDYSKEGDVGELSATKIVFEDNGNFTQELKARYRIQSAAALQAYGMLKFSYASQNSDVDIDYVRVIKPDGRTIDTPKESVLDMPSEVMQAAPFYSDEKEKRVAVKGLEVGDRVEYSAHWRSKSALIPGQFYYAYRPNDDGIVLDEELEISVPAARTVKLKSEKYPPTVENRGTYRVFSWRLSNTARKSEEKRKQEALLAIAPAPPILLTSFQSWDEIGAWVRSLMAQRSAPTPEIQAKAKELTQGLTNDDEKIQAIYSYVSTKFRYIGIAFGIGRYQPHSAAEVLANGYGDCKDKHTLLAALLEASGIHAEPALMNSSMAIDSDVPSPAQFDHVVTVVPRGSDHIWLDSTSELGPVGYLLPALRDKLALDVPQNGAIRLKRTPPDPPFGSFFNFTISGKLSSDGEFKGRARAELRGDSEILYRAIFRQAGEAKFSETVQAIVNNLGFGGTVSEVRVSAPEQTQSAFTFEYAYDRKEYGDWQNHRITPPFPPIFLPDTNESASPGPVKTEGPIRYNYDSQMELPLGVRISVPPKVDRKNDFAEYHAEYTLSGHTLVAHRELTLKIRVVPQVLHEEYKSLSRDIMNDADHWIAVRDEKAEGIGESATDPEATRLFEESERQYENQDFMGAQKSLQQAVALDPKFARAWAELGSLHVGLGAMNQAIGELRKAIQLDPQPTKPYKLLASSLASTGQRNEAIAVLKMLRQDDPEDEEAAANLGLLLAEQREYAEAIPELESAMQHNSTNSQAVYQLGISYARTGQGEKAVAAFRKLIAWEPVLPSVLLNNAAYELADRNLELDVALEFGQRAVDMDEHKSDTFTGEQARVKDEAGSTSLLVHEWDTLGWVYFRSGRINEAEKYLNAAWKVDQDSVIAEHLGELYEKQGRKREAMHFYALSLSTGVDPAAGTMKRLENLAGKDAPLYPILGAAKVEITKLRTHKISKPSGGKGSAGFSVLFQAKNPPEVHFLDGTVALKSLIPAISKVPFGIAFPDDSSLKLVQVFTVDCDGSAQTCEVKPPNRMNVRLIQ